MGKELNAEYYCEQGEKEFKAGYLEKAIDCYTQAIKKDPKCADAYFNRGACNLGKNEPDYQSARKDFLTALDLNPKDAGFCYLNLAEVETGTGNHKKAMEYSTKAKEFI